MLFHNRFVYQKGEHNLIAVCPYHFWYICDVNILDWLKNIGDFISKLLTFSRLFTITVYQGPLCLVSNIGSSGYHDCYGRLVLILYGWHRYWLGLNAEI